MTGRPTYRDGCHPTREGGWVPDIEFDHGAIYRLSRVVGRSLTAEEVERLQGFAALCRDRRESDVFVSSQAVIATLASIASEPDDRVQQAFDDCDEDTHCEIVRALHRMGEKRFFAQTLPPAKIKAAALLARAEFRRRPAGRRENGHRLFFLRGIPRIWRDLTGQDGKAWTDGSGKVSPVLEFSALLLRIVEPEWVGNDLDEKDLSSLGKQFRKINAGPA